MVRRYNRESKRIFDKVTHGWHAMAGGVKLRRRRHRAWSAADMPKYTCMTINIVARAGAADAGDT